MGKFENSTSTNNANYNSNILIKPRVSSLNNKKIGSMFNDVKNISTLNKIYGFSNSVDTHLSKNNEWAAVSYLSQSRYGIYSNGDCSSVEQNDSRLTGGLDYTTNVCQSTTGTIYGIYDMNGGKEEYVMGNYSNTISSEDGFSTLPDASYLNVYSNSENYSQENLQHALFETNSFFNNSSAQFVDSSNNWLIRNGLFSYKSNNGHANSNIGSRTILIIK